MVYTKQGACKDAIVPIPPSTPTLREPPSRGLRSATRSATQSSSIEARATCIAALDNAFSIDPTIKKSYILVTMEKGSMMIPGMIATKTRTGRTMEMRRAVMIKTKTKTGLLTKMRTMMMTMTISIKVCCLMTMMMTQLRT
jgi:hypothetical protein